MSWMRGKSNEEIWAEIRRNASCFPTSLLATSYLPSNDEPLAVQIEIRAAELAAEGIENAKINGIRELHGWYSHDLHDFSDDLGLTPELHGRGLYDWLAGWLAREIYQHEETK